RYSDGLRKVADKRECGFVDFCDLPDAIGKKSAPLTENGIQLTAYGYWRTAAVLEQSLGLKPVRMHIELNNDGKTSETDGVRVESAKSLSFQVTTTKLPESPPPMESPDGAAISWGELSFRSNGLPAGVYRVNIGGKEAASATAQAMASPLSLVRGPAFDQVEKLRETI